MPEDGSLLAGSPPPRICTRTTHSPASGYDVRPTAGTAAAHCVSKYARTSIRSSSDGVVAVDTLLGGTHEGIGLATGARILRGGVHDGAGGDGRNANDLSPHLVREDSVRQTARLGCQAGRPSQAWRR